MQVDSRVLIKKFFFPGRLCSRGLGGGAALLVVHAEPGLHHHLRGVDSGRSAGSVRLFIHSSPKQLLIILTKKFNVR